MDKQTVGHALGSKRVVVVGAGIAGLTAAHELVERGYEVEVVESEAAQTDESAGPAIGGMARTTWAVIPSVPVDGNPVQATFAPVTNVATELIELEEDRVPSPIILKAEDVKALIDDDGTPNATSAVRKLATHCVVNGYRLSLLACFAPIDAEKGPPRSSPKALSLAAAGVAPPSERFPPRGEPPGLTPRDLWTAPKDVKARAAMIAQRVGGLTPKPENAEAERHLEIDIKYVRSKPSMNGWIQLAAEVDRVPGEHGFRFFPSFYRHLFDTMKRIPLTQNSRMDPRIPNVWVHEDSARTVFDNLTSADGFELGLGRRGNETFSRTYVVPRRPLRSVYEVREFLANVLERAGYRASDVVRLGAKYLEYLTSSRERRRGEYESKTWSDFLGFEPKSEGRYSSRFQNHVMSAAQALVAMSTDTNDARTIGSIALQLTLDQARYNGYSDGTLNGPTTISFLLPWRDYLRSQGVRFTRAAFVGFEGEGVATRPVFGNPHPETEGEYLYEPIPPADYYCMTIPVNCFRNLLDNPPKVFFSPVRPKIGCAEPDQRITLLGAEQLKEVNKYWMQDSTPTTRLRAVTKSDIDKYLDFDIANPLSEKGAFRNMAGIQFYFDADVKIIKGHAMCQDSPWGVSYLSQAQYWQDRERGEDGFRGIISAIFTRFRVKVAGLGRDKSEKAAAECTREEIASRVWRQISDSWDEAFRGPLPKPRYFFLDPSLEFDESKPAPERRFMANRTPYLINRVDDWSKRGGRRTDTGDYEYDIQLGHTVFAGAFMRTTTRLNTMEASNESGRRAVNAILEFDKNKSQRCALWDPEQNELDDLRPLQELDRRVFAKGGKHCLNSRTTEAVLRSVPWDLLRLVLPVDERTNLERQ